MTPDRKALDATAFSLMLLLCLLWGVQQAVIKLTASYISLVMQAGIRSVIAVVLLLVWARVRGIALFNRDGTFWPGVAAGLLFAVEFLFIYAGLDYTNASRMVVFLYLTPPLTALGLSLFLPGERLRVRQWTGVLVSFGGLALAFSEGFATAGVSTWRGDLFGVIAAIFWAATTVVIRMPSLARATATKTLFYQLGISALLLPPLSWLMGESGVTAVTPLVAASLFYQGVIVAFASYLAWFWLLTRYLAARLSVLSFMTPLFGVLAGVLMLDEPLAPLFLVAALLVAGGIVLVNWGSGGKAEKP